MTLYGFNDVADRSMFFQLQTVSGVGAKLAMAALSVLSAEELAQAIATEDLKALQSIPGVGKRLAQRLALELKDKVAAFVPEGEQTAVQPVAPAAASLIEQVTEALVGLGFTDKAARPVVEAVVGDNAEQDTAVVLRAALSQLGSKR